MEIEVIHKYIAGKLEGKALQEFESKLASDVELNMEVSLQRKMLDHLQLTNDTATAQKAISEVHKEYEDPESNALKPVTPSRRWFVITGIFFMLLMLLLLLRSLNSEEKVDNKSLQFAEVPVLPEASFATKGLEDEDFLNEAAAEYNAQRYEAAILKLNQALDAGSTNVGEIEFYKGLSHLGSKNYSAAEVSFTELKNGYPLFATDANWYLAMTYWYSGNQSAAIQILKTFDSGNYRDKAQRYLEHVGRK